MKYSGCIMEVRRNSMMVMTTDCLFLEVKKREGVFVGMEIQFQSQDIVARNNKKLIQYISIAAVLLLLVVTQLFVIKPWDVSNQPVAVLSIDINPSIQLEIDEDEQVISAEALNSDAEEFPMSELINRPAKDALQQIIEVAETKGYITNQGENYVLVTSVSLLKDEAKIQRLDVFVQEVKESIETKASADNQVVVLTLKSDQETLKKAREEKLSVGKVEMINQIKTNTSMSTDEINGLNVRELVREAREKELSIPGWILRNQKENVIDDEDDDDDDEDDDEEDEDDDDDEDDKRDNEKAREQEKDKGNEKDKENKQENKGRGNREDKADDDDDDDNEANDDDDDDKDDDEKRDKEIIRDQEKDKDDEKNKENKPENQGRGNREEKKDDKDEDDDDEDDDEDDDDDHPSRNVENNRRPN